MTLIEKNIALGKQRLAVFLPNLGGGGAERVALAMVQGFLNRGYAVDLVLVRREGALLPFVPPEARVIDLGATKLRQAFRPLARYLREQRPYALHAMMWPLPLMALISRLFACVDTAIVGSEHTTLSTKPHGLRHRAIRALTRRAYLGADGIVAVSAGVADDLAAFIGLPRKLITVVHNPLLLPELLPPSSNVVEHWPTGTKRILAVGALKWEKNYSLLLHALKRLCNILPVSLLILGDGPLRGDLEKQIVELGLDNVVTLHGFESNPWPYYAAADVFVLSSDCEGFGNVLVEALHAGLPVVSTDCPNGPREILDNGRLGALVPCGDDAALATSIRVVLSTPYDPKAARVQASLISGHASMEAHLRLMVGG